MHDSYFSVAEKAYYNDYVNTPTSTESEMAILNSLKEIINFVEEGSWIIGWY